MINRALYSRSLSISLGQKAKDPDNSLHIISSRKRVTTKQSNNATPKNNSGRKDISSTWKVISNQRRIRSFSKKVNAILFAKSYARNRDIEKIIIHDVNGINFQTLNIKKVK